MSSYNIYSALSGLSIDDEETEVGPSNSRGSGADITSRLQRDDAS